MTVTNDRTEHTYELLTADNKTITWQGTAGPDAARRAADCLQVTVTAWREPRTFVGTVHHSQVIG